jgi:Zn-dependent protease
MNESDSQFDSELHKQIAANPSDPLAQAVEKLYSEKMSRQKIFVFLAISFSVFVGMRMNDSPLERVLLIAAILLIHELGHYVCMRLFGYRDVHILFLPFFGAMTSGQDTQPAGKNQAIVALAGPVPGIIIGLFFIYLSYSKLNVQYSTIGFAFLSLNLFNLIPVLPLDGGHFLEAILFARSKKLEAAFKVIAVAGLAFMALQSQDPLLGFIAFSVLATIKTDYVLARVAESAKLEIPEAERAAERVPPQHIRPLLAKMETAAPAGADALARCAVAIWKRMRSIPPTPLQSVGLFACYFAFAVVAVIGPSILSQFKEQIAFDERIEARELPDGQRRRCVVLYNGSHLGGWSALDDANLYDGPTQLFNPMTGVIAVRGQWKAGRRTGEWDFMDDTGAVEDTVSYENDQVLWRKHSTGEKRTWEQMSEGERSEYSRRPDSPLQRAKSG